MFHLVKLRDRQCARDNFAGRRAPTPADDLAAFIAAQMGAHDAGATVKTSTPSQDLGLGVLEIPRAPRNLALELAEFIDFHLKY